jgi:hypothetical protein
MKLTLQSVLVPTGEEGEGYLVFYEGWLVAILVRLSDLHGPEAGHWFLERGFDSVDLNNAPPFADLEAAQEWIRSHLADRSHHRFGPSRPAD